MIAIAWEPASYVFGAGLMAQLVDRFIEIIPYVSEDGSGSVAGWSVWIDQRECLGRFPGTMEAAIAVIENGSIL